MKVAIIGSRKYENKRRIQEFVHKLKHRWKDNLVGAQITDASLPEGNVVSRSNIAYIIDWAQLQAPAAVQDLIESGLKVRMAREPFEFATSSGKQSFVAGTILVPVVINSYLFPFYLHFYRK